ncbi:hypothetical protein HU200_021735 [Digitaria exilis]|uniref:Transcription factor CBF/NF-Y/archaeal histone domain-containing protein n=1 Tax=Digitaria exilis TaxID=1010633 RepID=A0A835EZN4_9POAL|nr:hypothetical protein HU200_021735 [Digitaria exilis]
MREAMPGNSKIAADAAEAMDKCVAEFTAVVTRAAREECRRDHRVIVTGDDLIVALGNLGFHDYVGPLNGYLLGYRESVGTMPRGWHTLRPPPETGTPAPPVTVEAETQPPPSPIILTLQLGPPSVGDPTEIGLHTDVYSVWHREAPPSTSQMPPAAVEDDE